MRKACWLVLLMGIPTAAWAQSTTSLEPSRLQELDSKRLHEFSNADLSDYLAAGRERLAVLTPAERIRLFAQKSMLQPYRLNATRFDLGEADCVVFVERALALSVSDDWNTYYRLFQRLSHKNGAVSMVERNYHPLADWVPNNAWILEDITAQLGATVTFSYSIPRKQYYRNLHFGETQDNPVARAKKAEKEAKIAAAAENETHTDRYLPKEKLAEALPLLRTGDVCLMIRMAGPRSPYVYCDHMGVLAIEDGEVTLLHSVPPRATQSKLRSVVGNGMVLGIKVLRIREGVRDRIAGELEKTSIPLSTTSEVDTKNTQLRNARTSQ